MKITFSESVDGIDWDQLALIFRRAPLGNREPEKLREAFEGSPIRCFAWDAGELVGAGRALSDGVWHTMVFDVVLLPEYQGRGVGTKIMDFLAERSKTPHVMLYSAPGKEGFYAKLGYRRMKTAMIKYVNPVAEAERRALGYIE